MADCADGAWESLGPPPDIVVVPDASDDGYLDVSRRAEDPSVRRADAEDLCATPYPSRQEALAIAHQLQGGGWLVIEHSDRIPRRHGDVCMIASVYHPISYESPGDLHVSTPDEGG